MGEASCCDEPQYAFIFLYIVYFVLVLVTWGSVMVYPLRLLATFVHEMSHAMACWLTGGEVHAIEVYENAGGVTKYAGGCRCIIAPAGYLGEAFWGMVFVVLSGGRKTATFAASGLVLALLISLCYSPNRTMVYLNLCYAVFTLAFIFVEWFAFTPILAFVTLLYGVFLGTYAVADIFSHLIMHTSRRSDAYHMYQETGRCACCQPKCIGVQWMIWAILFQLTGIWFALILMSEECQNSGWFECIFHSKFDLDFPNIDWPEWNF
jgi:hypothetical protein|mmetsp:Transcript_3656/g.6664  ORF Transcript_3656/g.6664 Transcript_3656/m.6664 type:complete len:264 (-) Transcript_3656:582-1373(-)